MSKRTFNIKPSAVEYENTGVIHSGGRTFRVIGFDFQQNKAIVANDRNETKYMSNAQVDAMARPAGTTERPAGKPDRTAGINTPQP